MNKDFKNKNFLKDFETSIENNHIKFYELETLLNIIEFYIETFDYEYSIKSITYSLKLYPNNLDIKLKWIKFLIYNNKIKSASNVIRKIKLYANNYLEFKLIEAEYWSYRKNHYMSIKLYKQCLKLSDYEKDYIYNNIADEYINLNKYYIALFFFKKALQYNQDNQYSIYSIIECYEKHINNSKKYEDFLCKKIDDNPNNYYVWFQLGLIKQKKNRLYEAIFCFDITISINPMMKESYIKKAECFENIHEYENAIICYKDILRINKNKLENIFSKIGDLNNKLNKKNKALHYYNKAIKLNKSLDHIWYKKSILHYYNNDINQAIYSINKAIQINNNVYKYYRQNIKYLNNIDDIIYTLNKMIELNPYNFNDLKMYMDILIKNKRYDKVILTGLKLINRFEKAEIYYQISVAYYMTNRSRIGDIYLNKAMNIDYNNVKNSIIKKYIILDKKINKNSSSK